MSMSEDDPRRMEAIRKYAAIYGRFDCKRKPEKPLTLHEVSVNEAAAQICSKIPSLLYRRDELFPLARQVVRDSGYQYSKGHSRSQSCRPYDDSNSESKRRRTNESSPGNEAKNAINEEERKRRHDRLEGIVDQLKSLGNKQEELKGQIQEANERQNFQEVSSLQNELEIVADTQMQLVNEKAELEKQQKRAEKAKDGEKLDDDTDSQFSMYSSESTPSLLQDSQQDSPLAVSVEGANSVGQSVLDVFNKPPANKKTKLSHNQSVGVSSSSIGPSMGNGSNSNDSLDFASKQLLNEALDEGLRMAKEMGHALDETIDLRLFNKYTEALRNSNCFGNLLPAIAESSSNNGNSNPAMSNIGGHQSSGSSRGAHKEGHRPRGRPPKHANTEASRDVLQSSFYEQIFSQAQLQQQMIANYQTQALQAALAFGDFATGLAGNGSGNPFEANNNNDKDASSHLTDFTMHLSEGKGQLFGDEVNGGDGKECDGEDKDEVTQSLNALISMANAATASEALKHELNLPPSVDFKIA